MPIPSNRPPVPPLPVLNLGIVGHAQDKFTPHTEAAARELITLYILKHPSIQHLISGGCHLGGADLYAEEIAKALDIPITVHKPKSLRWSGGYKERNLKIAKESDLVLCVVVKEYPHNYDAQRFGDCYHCLDLNPVHVKSGGCWTAWKCQRREWIII